VTGEKCPECGFNALHPSILGPRCGSCGHTVRVNDTPGARRTDPPTSAAAWESQQEGLTERLQHWLTMVEAYGARGATGWELADDTGIPQHQFSKHLTILHRQGFIHRPGTRRANPRADRGCAQIVHVHIKFKTEHPCQ